MQQGLGLGQEQGLGQGHSQGLARGRGLGSELERELEVQSNLNLNNVEPICVLQVHHSPSSPHLYLLKAVLSTEATYVLCERTVLIDSTSDNIQTTNEIFGFSSGKIDKIEVNDVDNIISNSERILNDTFITLKNGFTHTLCIQYSLISYHTIYFYSFLYFPL